MYVHKGPSLLHTGLREPEYLRSFEYVNDCLCTVKPYYHPATAQILVLLYVPPVALSLPLLLWIIRGTDIILISWNISILTHPFLLPQSMSIYVLLTHCFLLSKSVLIPLSPSHHLFPTTYYIPYPPFLFSYLILLLYFITLNLLLSHTFLLYFLPTTKIFWF